MEGCHETIDKSTLKKVQITFDNDWLMAEHQKTARTIKAAKTVTIERQFPDAFLVVIKIIDSEE